MSPKSYEIAQAHMLAVSSFALHHFQSPAPLSSQSLVRRSLLFEKKHWGALKRLRWYLPYLSTLTALSFAADEPPSSRMLRNANAMLSTMVTIGMRVINLGNLNVLHEEHTQPSAGTCSQRRRNRCAMANGSLN